MSGVGQVQGATPCTSKLDGILRSLEGRAPSQISVHEGPCCRAAREWFLATARSAFSLWGPEPAWIGRRWSWGPTSWPLHWCEVVERRELDCGALAELAALAWSCTGANVWRVQLVEEAGQEWIEEWQTRWQAAATAPEWIWGERFYHEVVGIAAADSSLRLWDPSAGGWRAEPLESPTRRILAIRMLRLSGPGFSPQPGLSWRGIEVPVGRWSVVALGTSCAGR